MRRSQKDRSRETRDRVLSATLESILEAGLRETSTVVVARRAAVSRGALLHHFPSKEDLLREALRRLLTDEVDRMHGMADDVAAERLDFEGLIDRIWEQFSGPLYMISLEFVTAARTDARIRDVLRDVGEDFNVAYAEIWDRLVTTELGAMTARRRTAFTATLCLMRGMATQSIWRDDPRVFTEIVAFWKRALYDLGVTAAGCEVGGGVA